jgi:hypothetical protein
MKKTIVFALALLALIASSGSAQVGIGFTAGYPVGYAFYYQANYHELPDPSPIFWGATVKWKHSSLLIDSGIGFWGAGSVNLSYGYVDLGVSLDLWIFRFGLAGGLDMVNISAPGYPSYAEVGPSVKTSLDLKLGPVTAGASAAFPLDVFLAFLRQEDIISSQKFIRIFAGHVSLNVVYWFGDMNKAQ